MDKNFENSNITVPEYIAQEMKKDMSKKKYGSSVLDYIPTNTDDVEDDNSAFVEDIMTDKEIEDARNELKQNKTDIVSEKTSTDAITGIKSSKETDDEEFDKLSDILNERDIRGKTITNSGRAMIKDLIKADPTEDELKNIAQFFEKHYDTNTDEYKKECESALGERITSKIKEITKSENEYYNVMIRFADQIKKTYQHIVQYNDDMKQLSLLAKKVNDYKTEDESVNDVVDLDKDFKNLTEIQKDITTFMEGVQKLDPRNRRLKNEYTIDDYDIRTVESVKDALDTALSFKLIYDKVSAMGKQYAKSFKDKKYVYNTIENWIGDIKSDSETLFTFPVNDFLSLEESRKQMIEFFYNTILLSNKVDDIGTIPSDVSDLTQYLLDNNKITNKEVSVYREQAEMTLFILTRVFKYKKLTSEKDRRILSYTLDLISKLGIEDHRDKFMDMSNFVYEKMK